jgi:hypothetical protein
MRRVRIIDEPDNTYAYAAIDRQTGEIPLRHHDRTELIALCRRLEWKIEEAEQDPLAGRRSAKFAASSRTNKRAGLMRPSARTS